jgi:type I restriction enzyme M protein
MERLVRAIDGIEIGSTMGHRARDIMGRAYEYCLAQFAAIEGRKGGQFYTPAEVGDLMVSIALGLRKQVATIYDPCCGIGGLFAAIYRAQGEAAKRVICFGQEANQTTWRMARMNAILRGMDIDFGSRASDTLQDDLHVGMWADIVLANPPFNAAWDSTGAEERLSYGVPPESNANFAWMQHVLSHLVPGGVAVVVMTNGAASIEGTQGDIRRSMISAGAVRAIVQLPDLLFYTTPIAASLWVMQAPVVGQRQDGRVVMVDASQVVGVMRERVHRALRLEEVRAIAAMCQRSDHPVSSDMRVWAATVRLGEIEAAGWVLLPSRYIRAARCGQVETLVNVDECLDQVEEEADVLCDHLAHAHAQARSWVSPVAPDRVVELGQLFDLGGAVLVGPSAVRQRDYVQAAAGVPMVMPSNIDNNGLIDGPSCVCVRQDIAARYSAHRLQTGDVLVSRRGGTRVGIVGAEEAGWLCGSGCNLLRDIAEVDAWYLFCCLRHPMVRQQMAALTVGTSIPSLGWEGLRRVRIPLVDVDRQGGVRDRMVTVIAAQRAVRAALRALCQGQQGMIVTSWDDAAWGA